MPEAQVQVDEIVAYVKRDSPDVGLKLNAKLLKTFELLARNPGLGRTRSDLTRRPLRFWNVHSYLVAYDPTTVPLEIVAVYRGSRQPGEWLG
jgi:plasmid stabilization system protein ParE